MELQTVKLNILIPLEYDKNEFGKSLEDNFAVTKEQAQSCIASGAYDSREWFHYCFRKKPIEANYQNANSPLLTNPEYQISRIELDSVVRSVVGLHKNENAVYTLPDINQEFRIGKIRILFTRSKAAFLHIETVASDLTEDAALRFINAFKQISSCKPLFEYKKKIARDVTETVRISLDTLVRNIVGLQNYLTIAIYENRINPYFQVCMIGSGETEDKERFFESVRSLEKRAGDKCIEDKYVYVGKQPYISRFVGDRAAFIFGDTGICGNDNLPFITDIGNGLAKTATENYLITYVFLVSLRLIVRKNDPSDPDIYYLINVPLHWSDEDNIREFFEKCLWESVWNLENAISLMRDRVRKLERDGHGPIVVETPQPKGGTMPPEDGEAPYVFLSYSHKNIEEAMDVVSQLQADGFSVWYDEELKPGSFFDKHIASHVKQCGCFMALLSRDYLFSRYCMDELFYAVKMNRPILPIYLEGIQLPDDVDMHICRLHAIRKYEYCDLKLFYKDLYECSEIHPCRSSERKADN